MTLTLRVAIVARRYAHHSAWSGYPRFAEQLGGWVRARRPRPVSIPAWALARASAHIVYEWFGPEQLRLDLTAGRRLLTGRGEVVHLLYGETDHFYAGRLRARGHRRGNRLVATFHQPPAVLDELLPAPPLFEQIDHAIALGPVQAQRLADAVGEARVSLAFLGVDTLAWSPLPAERAEVPTCAFVGSWFRDFDVLEEVVRAVAAAEPRVRFEVVSAPEHVVRLGRLPGVRARSGVSDEELRSVYRRSWVAVMPLLDAVANNALLEGLACGLPTVVSDVGDIRHYTGARGARLVRACDPSAMADAVLELLADPGARERLGQDARAAAEARSLEASARRHAEIYALVAARTPLVPAVE